jgi:hypothetical protein
MSPTGQEALKMNPANTDYGQPLNSARLPLSYTNGHRALMIKAKPSVNKVVSTGQKISNIFFTKSEKPGFMKINV